METVLAIVLSVVVLGAILAFVSVALVQVQRDAGLDRVSHLLWSVGILLVPVIGALLWYVLKPRDLVTVAAIRSGLLTH